MNSARQQFGDLERVIDEVHALFDHWENSGVFSPAFDADKVQLMKLAVHEWLANLVQHAHFGDRTPEIHMDVTPNGKRVRCVIVDNSDGFDLGTYLNERRGALPVLPERGMGLLMLDAATEYMNYHRDDDGCHRLEFSVSADEDPWLNIPF
ncbi:MAG: ATP-binding protein [Rhodothermales bacterium]|nr:ATP-binding protein [Rhodothermales bacterium]